MKKMFICLFVLGSLSSYAESPFDQFIGEYSVVSEDCKSTSSYLEELNEVKIVKGTTFNRNLEDTFIYFKRGGYYTSSLNLSAFYSLTDYTPSSGAIFIAKESKIFSLEKVSEEVFLFNFQAFFGESKDDCSYKLERKSL